MSLAYVRHMKSKQINLLALTSTVVTTTAGVNGAAVSVSGYIEGIFHNYMTLNTSGAPSVMLQSGIVPYGMTTTVWAILGTIDADMTTTANNTAAAINHLPNLVRAVIAPVTTTASVTTITCIVDGVVKV